MLARALTAACCCLVVLSPVTGAGQAAPEGTVADWLSRYQTGHRPVSIGSPPASRLAQMRRDLARHGPAWIGALGPAEERARRLTVATFVLEVVHDAFPLGTPRVFRNPGWIEGRQLIEWACQLLTRRGPPRPEERIWHLAAIALIEGAGDAEFLVWQNTPGAVRTRAVGDAYNQIGHARARFPEEPRLRLAVGTAYESTTWPDPPPTTPWITDEPALKRAKEMQAQARERRLRLGDRERVLVREFDRRAALVRTMEEFAGVRDEASVGAEANLHIGRLLSRLRRYDAALPFFARAKATTDDVFVRYLAFFFAADALERAGRPEDVEDGYRAALESWPRAASASIALARRLDAGGHREEASRLVQATFFAAPPTADPWVLYGYGSFRTWPGLIEQLRNIVGVRS